MKLHTLTYRQVRGDMIAVYKCITGKFYDINRSAKLQCRHSKFSTGY